MTEEELWSMVFLNQDDAIKIRIFPNWVCSQSTDLHEQTDLVEPWALEREAPLYGALATSGFIDTAENGRASIRTAKCQIRLIENESV